MRAFEFLKENQVIDEAPLPSDWDPKMFKPETSYDERIHYALQRAKKLGAGSSRVAMTIEYEGRPTALKIALSQKGRAQNEVEKDILSSAFAKQSNILIPLIDYDKENKQPIWVQVEQAEWASTRQLMDLLGCNLYDLSYMSYYIFSNQQDRLTKLFKDLKDKNITDEAVKRAHQYATQIAVLAKNFDLDITDFENPDNWGIYKGRPVIIDVGANTEVIKTYYTY